MSEPSFFTYLSFISDNLLSELQRDYPELMALVDESHEVGNKTGLLIHICDRTEWWKQEDELLEFLTEFYLSLYFLIDPAQGATATMFMDRNHSVVDISPQLMAICTSLRIRIVVHLTESDPPTSE